MTVLEEKQKWKIKKLFTSKWSWKWHWKLKNCTICRATKLMLHVSNKSLSFECMTLIFLNYVYGKKGCLDFGFSALGETFLPISNFSSVDSFSGFYSYLLRMLLCRKITRKAEIRFRPCKRLGSSRIYEHVSVWF